MSQEMREQQEIEEACIRRIDELEDQVTDLEAENEELRNQIAKFKNGEKHGNRSKDHTR